MYLNIDTERGLNVSDGLTAPDALRLLGTATLAVMQGVTESAEDTVKDEVRGELYDMFNRMAGNILDMFDPTRCPGTDLTERAILEAENAILDREYPDDTDTTTGVPTEAETLETVSQTEV